MHFISHASELEIKDLHNNLEFFFFLPIKIKYFINFISS